MYVREVHVRYYIWREDPDCLEPHVSRKDKSVGRNHVSGDFQIQVQMRKPVSVREAEGIGPS